MSSNCLVFHTSGGISSSLAAFLFLIFLITESSSSWVNGPSLMFTCLLIVLAIGSCVTFGGFPRRFSKCCFHSLILSSLFAAFSFALAVLFLLLTSFIVCYAILACLSSTESLILSISFCMYSVCSLCINWYCAVFSFRAFVFVGFYLNVLEAVFTCACFSLTANVSHASLYLVLGSPPPRYAHWRNSHIRHLGYLFPSSLVVSRIVFSILLHIYLLCLCCWEGPRHSVWWSLFVWRFFRRLSHIFAMSIWWSEDTPSKEEYASQLIALFFHFLFIKT